MTELTTPELIEELKWLIKYREELMKYLQSGTLSADETITEIAQCDIDIKRIGLILEGK